MKFKEIIDGLDHHIPFHKEEWNGEKFIVKQIGSTIPTHVIPRMTSLSEKTKEIILEMCGHITYHDQIIIVDVITGKATSYTITPEDIFNANWEEFTL